MRNKRCWFDPAWRESGQFWTPRYLTDVFKGILLHPMSAESVYQPGTKWSANSHCFCFVSIQHELIAVHPWQNIISTCLNAWLDRTKFIRRCKSVEELRIVSILVKIALVIRNYFRQRLGLQCEHNENRPQNRTLGYSIHKGARNRRYAINNNRLTAIMDIGCKPPKSNAPNSESHL